jgi:hypothetical protein
VDVEGNKGLTFGELGRHEDGVAVYNDVVARFASALELPFREQVARALAYKQRVERTRQGRGLEC